MSRGEQDLPEGFEAVAHRSLFEPIMLGGAPRSLAILNGTLAAAIGLGLQQWAGGLILALVGHSLCVIAAKRDPQFGPVLLRHMKQRGYWSC